MITFTARYGFIRLAAEQIDSIYYKNSRLRQRRDQVNFICKKNVLANQQKPLVPIEISVSEHVTLEHIFTVANKKLSLCCQKS